MAAARRMNWFAIWISVGVVVALVLVAALVVWMNTASTAPGEAPEASNIDTETGAIHVGDGPDVLATYIDFMCSVCGQFEQLYGETIESLVDDGSITLDIHAISILDRASQGSEFSTRSANAMYCVAVADESASLPFLQAMFEVQPEEGTPGLTNEDMLGIASDVGVTGIDDCVNDGRYSKWVADVTEKTPVNPEVGGIATPTVILDGEFVDLTGDPQADIVDALE